MLYKDIKKHNCRDPFPRDIPNTMSITMSIIIFSSMYPLEFNIAIENDHL